MNPQPEPGVFSRMRLPERMKDIAQVFAVVADYGGGERGKLVLLTRAEDARRIAEPEPGAVYPRDLAEQRLSENERYRSLWSLRKWIATAPKRAILEINLEIKKRSGLIKTQGGSS